MPWRLRVLVILGVLALQPGAPVRDAMAEESGADFAAFLAGEEKRFCDLAKADDTAKADIEKALSEVDRYLRIARAEVQRLEMARFYWGGEMLYAAATAYQDIHEDEIGFIEGGALSAARGTLSLTLASTQPAFDRLYSDLDSEDPSEADIKESVNTAESVELASLGVGAALFEILGLDMELLKGRADVLAQKILEKVSPEVVDRVLAEQADTLALLADLELVRLPQAQANLQAMQAFHKRTKACLEGWTQKPGVAGNACLPFADLSFNHPDLSCAAPEQQSSVKVVTGAGESIDYLGGCATALYGRYPDDSVFYLFLTLTFDAASFQSEKVAFAEDGSFKGRLTFPPGRLPRRYSVSLEGRLLCGGDGLPTALAFDCVATDAPDDADFYEAFGQGATVSCPTVLPRDPSFDLLHAE